VWGSKRNDKVPSIQQTPHEIPRTSTCSHRLRQNRAKDMPMLFALRIKPSFISPTKNGLCVCRNTAYASIPRRSRRYQSAHTKVTLTIAVSDPIAFIGCFFFGSTEGMHMAERDHPGEKEPRAHGEATASNGTSDSIKRRLSRCS
jgi:hypothetical protein